jgi:hypothetical protein
MRSAGLIENYIEQPNKLSFKSLKPDAWWWPMCGGSFKISVWW